MSEAIPVLTAKELVARTGSRSDQYLLCQLLLVAEMVITLACPDMNQFYAVILSNENEQRYLAQIFEARYRDTVMK